MYYTSAKVYPNTLVYLTQAEIHSVRVQELQEESGIGLLGFIVVGFRAAVRWGLGLGGYCVWGLGCCAVWFRISLSRLQSGAF